MWGVAGLLNVSFICDVLFRGCWVDCCDRLSCGIICCFAYLIVCFRCYLVCVGVDCVILVVLVLFRF